MSYYYIILPLIVLFNHGRIAECDCVAGEGERFQGIVWYKVRKSTGVERPIGCCYLGQKLRNYERIVEGNFVFICTNSPENGTMIYPIACVQNGIHFGPGVEISDGLLYYSCERVNDFIVEMKISGCADKSGKKVDVGRTFETRHFLYLCERVGSVVQARGIACIVDGKRVDVGNSYDHGDFWFYCQKRGRRGIRKEAAGCVHNGTRFLPNEQFMKGNFLFKCEIATPTGSDDEVSRHRALACYHEETNGNSSFYGPGAYWYVRGEYPNMGYKVVCQKREENMWIEATECYFEEKEIRRTVLPGLGFTANGTVYACDRNEKGFLQIYKKDPKPVAHGCDRKQVK